MVVRKRLNLERPGLVFITTTVVDWNPIFLNDEIAVFTLNQLYETSNFYQTSICIYSLMPSHLHAILKLQNLSKLSNVLGSFKSLSSRKIKAQFSESFISWPNSTESFQFWKFRFDDFIIRNIKQLEVKMNYIHENPVRAKFVERAIDWKYSSARDWLLDEPGIIEIDKDIF